MPPRRMPWLIPQCPRYGLTPPAAADCTMICLAECRQWVHASRNRRHIRHIGQDPDPWHKVHMCEKPPKNRMTIALARLASLRSG
jgi:hypothetical protein